MQKNPINYSPPKGVGFRAINAMKIPGIVIFAHALLIAALLYFHTPQPEATPRRSIKVETFALNEEKRQTPIAPKPEIKKIQKPVAVAVTKPKPTPPPKENREKEKKLLGLMQQSLASLDKRSEIQTVAPKKIGHLSCESIPYQDRLVAFLEGALTLPEKGEVKLALTLNRTGAIQKVAIKEGATDKNRTYVEGNLKTLLLPPFEHHFKGESAHTFSITLTSS